MTDSTHGAAAEAKQPDVKPLHPLKEFWSYFSVNTGAVIGLYFIIFVILVAVFADVISPWEPYFQNRDASLAPPVWMEGGSWSYILGADATGRDILSRIIHGSRYSLFIGCIAISIALTVGVSLGLTSAFLGGIYDTVVMRLMDIILSLPGLLLALVIVAIIGPGLENAMIAVGIVFVPHFVRLTRASALSEKNKPYVIASRVAGANLFRLMFIVVLPNCMGPLIVQATLSFSTAVLDAAALGFLGLGAQPPLPEWGTMLADAREFITRAWWVITFPGIAILLTVLAFNLMGDGLRDALDPKLKKS